jgi:CTP:molybdopterin cytidylyltransferase MocA
MSVAGLVLAAGGGVRFGGPKALGRDPDGTFWLRRATDSLRAGGCESVYGESAVVVAADWAAGASASLAAGLAALPASAEAVAIVTVDVPSLSAAMVERLSADADADTLRQASFHGRPGHPVVIGRSHWAAVRESLHGDVGARPYLLSHGVTMVRCEDLGSGEDVDSARSGSA